jgi:hypothetical protein
MTGSTNIKYNFSYDSAISNWTYFTLFFKFYSQGFFYFKKSTLSNLNKPSSESDESGVNGILSPEFEIVNLKESLEIVENLKKLDKEELKQYDLKKNNGMPSKFLEIILTSPVFFNPNLIPNCKYKYNSHFKRSQFSESEKM